MTGSAAARDAACQLLGKDAVDHAVAFHAALSGKDIGFHHHLEMGLATLTPTGVASMLVAYVSHLDLAR